VKHLITILTVAAFLTGCSGKQDAVLNAHNGIVAAENIYSMEVQTGTQNEDINALIQANEVYFQVVKNSKGAKNLPADYINAIQGLEDSLTKMVGFLKGINDPDNIDLDRLMTLDENRLNATRNLNSVAKSHGLTLNQ
jgi:hypothetical protein